MTPERVIVKARTTVMTDYPFFGPPIIKPEYVNDPSIRTLATDYERIFFNPALIMEYCNQSNVIIFFLLHEVFHMILKHNLRQVSLYEEYGVWKVEGLEWKLAILKEIFGYASDYEVNALLKDLGLPLPEWVLYEENFHGKSVEEIFHLLMDKVVIHHQPQPQPGAGNGDGEDGDGEKDDSDDGDTGKGDATGDGAGDDAGDNDGDSAGGGDDDGDDSDDDDGKGGGGDDADDEPEPTLDKGSITKQLNPETATEPIVGEIREFEGTAHEAERIDETWKRVLIEAEDVAKAMGKGSPGISRFVKEKAKPEVPWLELIRPHMEEKIKEDFDWNSPNRRFISRGIILPSLDGEQMGEMVIANDTSGSRNGRNMAEAEAEINSVLEDIPIEGIMVIHCDDGRQGVWVEKFEKDDVPIKLTPMGGGGTDFRPPFEYLENEDIEPKLLIYLTDGYGTFPEEEPPFPVLWIIDNDHVNPPWGDVIRVNYMRY